MRWAFPVTVLLHLPGRGSQRCTGSSIVLCPGFPFRASGAVYHTPTFSTAGTSGASQVLRRLSSCMPRPEDSGGPPPPRPVGGIVLPSGAFKPSASAIAMSKLYQHFRGRGSLCGLQESLSTLRPSCSPGRIETPTPPWTLDSLRVCGSPLPDRDLHPARDAKLFLAR